MYLYYGAHNGGTVNTATFSAPVDNGSYHVLTIVVSSGVVKAYVDGTQKGSATLSGSIATCASGLTYLGGRPPSPGTSYFQGTLGKTVFYNYALTSTQISQLTC
jgi:hypothetical protein